MSQKTAWGKVLEHFGGELHIAIALGVSARAVEDWRRFGVPVPRRYQIQVMTEGKVPAAEWDQRDENEGGEEHEHTGSDLDLEHHGREGADL